MLFVGKDYPIAMEILETELMKMQMKLNPKKVEYLDAQHWFKFLGFSIKGHSIHENQDFPKGNRVSHDQEKR